MRLLATALAGKGKTLKLEGTGQRLLTSKTIYVTMPDLIKDLAKLRKRA